jgi:hypothetical protein
MNIATIQQLIDIAFPGAKGKVADQVNLLTVCLQVCLSGDAIGRVSGRWDSRDSAIDLIMQPENLREFS